MQKTVFGSCTYRFFRPPSIWLLPITGDYRPSSPPINLLVTITPAFSPYDLRSYGIRCPLSIVQCHGNGRRNARHFLNLIMSCTPAYALWVVLHSKKPGRICSYPRNNKTAPTFLLTIFRVFHLDRCPLCWPHRVPFPISPDDLLPIRCNKSYT
jgi:hypothetical protein